MRREDVQLLQCPYCLSRYSLGHERVQEKKEIVYGSLYCDCDEFPIIEGVLFLHRPLNRTLLEYVRSSEFHKAFLLAISQKRWLHPESVFGKILLKYLGKRNMLEYLRELGKERVISILRVLIPTHLLRYYFRRAEWRDALTIFLPLVVQLRKKQSSATVLWFDVGAGVVNFYKEMQTAFPRLKFVSLDSNFLLLILSKAFYPGRQVLRICGDAHFLQTIRDKKVDVVTFIDSLDSFSGTSAVLRQAFDSDWLKKSSILFISGLQTHLHVDKRWGIYPVPLRVAHRSIPSLFHPVFLRTKELSDGIVLGNVSRSDVQCTHRTSLFRYSVYASQDTELPERMDFQFVPQKIRKDAQNIWDNPPKTWENNAY
jgi:uncharacterized protein YbaR (Trm112 family)